MENIIDGIATAGKLKALLELEITEITKNYHAPCLAIIRVGDITASKLYVAQKCKQAQAIGIKAFEHYFPENVSQEALEQLIIALNGDSNVNGIIVQLPLPEHINTFAITDLVAPLKDVDGLSTTNAGNLFTSAWGLRPCTPVGCLLLLREYVKDLSGKQVLIIGRSQLVGRPLALILIKEGCTVTVAHRQSRNIQKLSRESDIVISATGVPGLVKSDWVKKETVVIDVGINKDDLGQTVGDVDFDEVSKIVSLITPVPGGVGPMTVSALLMNVVLAFHRQTGSSPNHIPFDPLKRHWCP